MNEIYESEVERQICDYAEATGWLNLKIKAASKRGVMDRVFIKDGVHLWCEIKRPKKTSRQQQKLRAREMTQHGALCFEFDNFKAARATLDLYSI